MAKLAEVLNSWFALTATHDDSGRHRELSTADVAEAISADPTHDVSISRSYLAGLRNGGQTNPTIAVVDALVRFFRDRLSGSDVTVSVAALIGDEGPLRDPADADWDELLADRQIKGIAMRAGTMTPAVREQVLKMMDVLDPPPAGGNSGR